MSSKICVIGSNSFSGASFCKYLLERGHEVVALSRSSEPVDALLPYKWCESNQVHFHQLDLNKNLLEIDSLLNSVKPSIIYNFAAQSMVGQSWDYPEHWFQTNTVAFSKLINILKSTDYLERYVHVTTPEVYGSTDGFIDENQPFNPTTPYAISRAAGDNVVNAYYRAFDFPFVATRAANVYGEGQQLYRIIPKTILSILLGKTLPLHGGGVSRRSFIHIDDVSSATFQIANNGQIGNTYHISTDRIVSIRELVELLCTMLNADFEKQVEVGPERIGKDDAYLLNCNKLKSNLTWQDQVSLENGLQRTINWVKSNYDVLSNLSLQYEHKE